MASTIHSINKGQWDTNFSKAVQQGVKEIKDSPALAKAVKDVLDPWQMATGGRAPEVVAEPEDAATVVEPEIVQPRQQPLTVSDFMATAAQAGAK